MKRFLTIVLSLALLLTLAIPALAFSKVRLSTQNLMVNGKPVDCEKYNIDGSNYFKLRDLAKLLDGTESQFDVGWDGAKKLVTLTTNHAYTTARGDELTVGTDQSATTSESRDALIIDGVERRDIAAYKIGGSNFFKLRDLGDALGFDVDYIEATKTATVASRSSLKVTDLCAVAGDNIEYGGYLSRYSYVLPKLSGLDTAYIREINADMQALYDNDVAEAVRHIDAGDWMPRFCISYRYGVKNGVHSLLVTEDSDYGTYEFRCYNFNALGNKLDNEAVLAAAGLTEDRFLSLSRAYLTELTDLSEYYIDDGWKQYQADTISPENLNAEVPMAILPDGTFCFVCSVHVPAGAGIYAETFTIGADGTVSRAALGRILRNRLSGCFLEQAEGGSEATLYEFVGVGDTIMLELTHLGVNEGTYDVYSYSAIELFPEDYAALYRADADELRVRAVAYSPDASTGTYNCDALNCTLAVTEDGITLTDEAGGTVHAVRCYRDELDLSEGLPEQDYEKFSYDAVETLGIAGSWAGTYTDENWQTHSLTLELTGSGNMTLRDCTPKAIPTVLQGYFYIAGPDEEDVPEGDVVFRLARRGGYKMPVAGHAGMTVNEDGTLQITEATDVYAHLTSIGEGAASLELKPIPTVRRVAAPTVRRLAENERAAVDISADGLPETVSYAFGRDPDNGDEIGSVTVTVDGREFVIDSIFAYDADAYLITTGMSGTAWLYIDCLNDNDYHFLTVIGIRPGEAWWAGEFAGGFVGAPADPEALQLRSRFHLVSTLNAVRTYRIGMSGFPEPVDSFYRVVSDLTLTSMADIEGWRVDEVGGLVDFMTIPAGTVLKPIRTDGVSSTDLQLPDGSVCRIWSSGIMGAINGIDVFDCFEDAFFAG